MYVVFFGVGEYKVFSDKNIALEFCKVVGFDWIDC